MKKRRVCCFCEQWGSGGIESFLSNVLTHVDMEQLEIDLVTAQLEASVFTERLQQCGVRFWELSGSKTRVFENQRKFHRLLREKNYDVVHLNVFQGMSLYYAHLAKQAGVPVRIAHSHNTDLRQSRTRAIKLWLHRVFSERYGADATECWACSGNAAEFMFPKTLLNERGATFIPNGIHTAKFCFDESVRKAVRCELGVEDCFVVGNVGRLCYQKNQSFLLEVFAQMLERRPDSCLLLVGEGEDRSMLEERAKELGIFEQVLFYGVTDSVEKLFCAMDVFAFPSRFEGLGIVAVEAQASGLPVVCSENVPQEACVTALARSADLGAGARFWAELLLKAGENGRLLNAAAEVKLAGFDVVDVAQLVQGTYIGEVCD